MHPDKGWIFVDEKCDAFTLPLNSGAAEIQLFYNASGPRSSQKVLLTCDLDDATFGLGGAWLVGLRLVVPGVALAPVAVEPEVLLHLLPRHIDRRLQVLLLRHRVLQRERNVGG